MKQKIITGVMGAAVNQQKEVLICLRNDPKNPQAHKKWQLPGGGVEFGESPEETLHREIKEEIGVSCKILFPYPIIKRHVWYYERLHAHIQLACYPIFIGDQELVLEQKEILDYQWIQPDAIKKYDHLPLVDEFIAEIAVILNKYSFDFVLE